jgi:beta-galactosidase
MKKTLAAFLALILATLVNYGKDIKPLRYHLLMDKGWKFYLGDDAAAKDIGFNDVAWRILNLPHDWSIEGEFKQDAPTGGGGGYLPTGIGWYRKAFKMPVAAKNKQVSIQFDGAYHNSEVWLNGHLLGKRPNGYISFVYDMTPYLNAGNNTLAVRVDNSDQPNSRWYSGSGIYRHVWFNITGALHVAQWGTAITTPQVTDAMATVLVKTQVENKNTEAKNATLIAEVIDERGKVITTEKSAFSATANAITPIVIQLKVTVPLLWDVDHPHLYTLRTTIQNDKGILDNTLQSFGIRNIEYSSTNGFLLNGKRIKNERGLLTPRCWLCWCCCTH